MVAAILLATALAAAGSAEHHVRSSDRRIHGIFMRGLEQSPTLRQLVAILDDSDVIVYVDEQQRLPDLGGYLSHHVVAAGRIRYLRVKTTTAGPIGSVVARMAHELQHAVEVAQAPAARDLASLQRLFGQVGLSTACDPSRCFETQAARDVEFIVRAEMNKRSAPVR